MNEEPRSAFDNNEGGLSYLERVTIRNRLLAFMSEYPATAPWHIRALDRVAHMLRGSGGIRARGVFVTACALVLVIGVGTSYAAQHALPGEALYPIKVRVNEPITGVLMTSGVAKAKWDTELVSRRLAEAEKLAAERRLTSVARTDIEEGIALSTADFNANVAKIAQSENQASVAEAQSHLEASLAGHEEVLATLSEKDDQGVIAPVLAMVHIHKRAAANGRADAEAHVERQTNTAEVRSAALATRQRVDQEIQAMTMAIQNASQDTSTTTETARASAALAQHTAEEGNTHLEDGDYGKAFAIFQTAERVARGARVHMDALENIRAAFDDEKATTSATTTATSSATTTFKSRGESQ